MLPSRILFDQKLYKGMDQALPGWPTFFYKKVRVSCQDLSTCGLCPATDMPAQPKAVNPSSLIGDQDTTSLDQTVQIPA